jgi:hypothetical protein
LYSDSLLERDTITCFYQQKIHSGE